MRSLRRIRAEHSRVCGGGAGAGAGAGAVMGLGVVQHRIDSMRRQTKRRAIVVCPE